MFNVQLFSFAFNNVLTIPLYSLTRRYTIAIGTVFIIGTALTYIFRYESKEKEKEGEKITSNQGSVQSVPNLSQNNRRNAPSCRRIVRSSFL